MEAVLDSGNSFWKWFRAKTNHYNTAPHAIARLSDSAWDQIVGRGKPPAGVMKVNGIPYAAGSAARRHTIIERPKGAARYKKGYYDVGLALALVDIKKASDLNVTLIASYAPIDIKYSKNLVMAAKGLLEVECQYGELQFDVKRVLTFDEPIGGYSHYVFTEKGIERKRNPLDKKTTLVIDVGGHTVDVVAIDPGGVIDTLSAKSTRLGTIDTLTTFESELRSHNSTMFQDVGDIDPRRLEDAFRTGVFKFGKVNVDCSREAEEVLTQLVNDVIQVINAAGGVANFDVMLVTGGGSALIYDALCIALPRVEFILAEPNRDLMMYSNVFGGAKIAALLRQVQQDF
jgi:hypothetical protein